MKITLQLPRIPLVSFLRILCGLHRFYLFFFFNDTATTEIYTLSLHDALPISSRNPLENQPFGWQDCSDTTLCFASRFSAPEGRRSIARGVSPWNEGGISLPCIQRSEEHTSELQSRSDLVCRLLLEKKKEHKQHRKNPAGTEQRPNHPDHRRRVAQHTHAE